MDATEISFDEDLAAKAATGFFFFRVPIIIGITWFLWGINVWTFNRHRIDYCDLLDFNRSTLLSASDILSSGALFLLFICSLAFLYLHWPFADEMIIPILLYSIFLLVFILPFDILHRSGREKFMHNFYRVIFPLSSGVLFVEVVLGDVLTSLSKVLADTQVIYCIIISHIIADDSNLHHHNALIQTTQSNNETSINLAIELYGSEKQCAESWLRPMVTSLPFLFRFYQCYTQYKATGKAFPNLLNCLKYFTSLPVIWISAYRIQYGKQDKLIKLAWILAVSVNSFYSFMWDIVMDWGLCRHGSRHFLLRERLLYSMKRSSNSGYNTPVPIFYYAAIAVDFILRILWSFNLASFSLGNVHVKVSSEFVTFALEICEVFRRFLWLFFRIEWESLNQHLYSSDTEEADEESKQFIEMSSHALPSPHQAQNDSKKVTALSSKNDNVWNKSTGSSSDPLKKRTASDRLTPSHGRGGNQSLTDDQSI